MKIKFLCICLILIALYRVGVFEIAYKNAYKQIPFAWKMGFTIVQKMRIPLFLENKTNKNAIEVDCQEISQKNEYARFIKENNLGVKCRNKGKKDESSVFY